MVYECLIAAAPYLEKTIFPPPSHLSTFVKNKPGTFVHTCLGFLFFSSDLCRHRATSDTVLINAASSKAGWTESSDVTLFRTVLLLGSFPFSADKL